jgi:hypothetical protein
MVNGCLLCPPNDIEFSGERKRVRCNEGLGADLGYRLRCGKKITGRELEDDGPLVFAQRLNLALSLKRRNWLRGLNSKIVVQASAVEKRRERGGARKETSNAKAVGKMVDDLDAIGFGTGSAVEECLEHH